MPFGIKTTEAPHSRRVVQERSRGIRWDGRVGIGGQRSGVGEKPRESFGFQLVAIGRAKKGVNDRNGFVFVDHLGNITPSGFLPLVAGNGRNDDLVKVYRHHRVFCELRDPNKLRGKCGRCEFRSLCGGSRARAYAMTGDYLKEEPCCLCEPAPAVQGVEA